MKTILPYILIAVAIMTGCRKSEIQDEPTTEGQDTQIHLRIGDDSGWNPVTRSYGLTPGQEQVIQSIEVLIFNSAQNLVSRTKLNTPTNLTNTIHTKSGSGMSVYVVTNTSLLLNANALPGDVLGRATTVSQLLNIKITNLLSHVNNNSSMPMCGFISNVTINPTGSNTITVPLSFVAAKITVNVRKSLPVNEDFELVDWKLASLARYCYLFPRPTDIVNITDDNDFLTQASTSTWDDGTIDVAGVSTPVKTTTFYIFENRRGITSNTDARLKSGNTAPPRATKLVARGYHKSTTGVTGVDVNLMFGENSINDYNVERTKQYVYNINIKGLNDYNIDTRYTSTNTGFQAEVMNPTLDAHYDFRPLRVGAFQGSSVVEILDENGNTTNSTFWLKVSQKDITKFVNISGTFSRPTYNPASEMLQTINIAHTNPTAMESKMVYLYSDEFLTEASNRVAKVKVTYTPTSGTALPPTVITINQRGILLAGDNVGLREVNTSNAITPNQYSFGIELIDEATLSITPGNLANERTINMQWGFNGISMISVNKYGLRNGFEHTKTLVMSDQTSGALRPPYGRTGAVMTTHELYNPIYNTYAARYCFEKNRDLNGDGVILGNEIKWYLPSMEEVILIYIGNKSWSSVPSESWDNYSYQSSSQYSTGQNMAVYYTLGYFGIINLNQPLNVRCARKM